MTISLTAAMQQNLYSLQQTNSLMDATQTRLATGKKVNSALDDPVNFFRAKEHEQRAGDLEARKDSMGEAIQTVKAASVGIESITSLLEAAKSLAQTAISSDSTTDVAALAAQYNTTLTQLDYIATNSSYKGINLLGGSTQSIEVKFSADGLESLTVTGFDASSGSNGLNLTAATTGTSGSWGGTGSSYDTTIKANITEIDLAIDKLRTEESKLSNNLSIITTRQDFTDKMMNVLKTGANNLTNADMNEEGANMLMLQTRQQLGTSSLSIASQAAQAVLRLF